jgi:hypothetical protein
MKRILLTGSTLALAALAGCDHFLGHGQNSYGGPGGGDVCADGSGKGGRGNGRNNGPGYDRPFPVGQYTDAFWETQQTNAEAADFIFYDHEFRGNTAELAPGAKQHLQQVALRLEHVPFPVVIEQTPHNARPDLDQARRRTVVEQLARLGVVNNLEERVVVANAFPEGYTEQESESSYYNGILSSGFGGGSGRRFGGTGGMYR